MDSSRSPPCPTFFPTVRLQGSSHTSFASRAFSPSQAESTPSPPSSRPLSTSTHLLQDLEPRTYDSPSDAESAFSRYKDSPPTPTQQKGSQNQTQTQAQIQAQSRRRTSKWPARRFDGRTTHNDSSEEQRGLELKRTSRWSQTQTQTYDDSPQDKHFPDPIAASQPIPLSRLGSKTEDEVPPSASRRVSVSPSERDEKLEDVQPGWLRAQKAQQQIRFSIPPPITGSLMLPIKVTGEGRAKSDESLLSSIFGAFSGTSRWDRGLEDSEVVGRNRVSKLGEQWTDIVRQERVMHDRIQGLLDQQAASLQEVNDGGKGTDEGASTRSGAGRRSSITVSGRGSRGAPSFKRALNMARMELSRAMYTLTDLATAKETVLQQTSSTLKEAHRQLQTWQLNLNTTEAKLKEFDNAANVDDGIWKELQELEPLILELERRLKIAKERKKMLLKQQKETQSEREADAAKWVETKRSIDKEVGRWLREPSVPSDMLEGDDNYWSRFMSLTPQRRNLDVAIESLGGAIRGIRKRLAGAQVERDACERGAKLWSDSLEVVMKGEKEVKGLMEMSLRGEDDGMDEMVACMKDTEQTLRERVGVAENEGWNLVICALGAEVEAWRKGLEIMRGMHKVKGKERSITPQQNQKGDEPCAKELMEHEDAADRRLRGASLNTNSTEDPMWGSGVDKDAELLGDLEATPDDVDASPLVAEGTGSRDEMRDSRDSGVGEGSNSRPRNAPENCYTIITEGLRVSPSHSASPSPWRANVKGRGSVAASPVKAVREEEDSQPATPDREASFRTARELSLSQEMGEMDELGAWAREGKESGRREEGERERQESSPEALTPREQRVPPHRRKGKGNGKGVQRAKMDGGRDNESDDGEVPVDLLG